MLPYPSFISLWCSADVIYKLIRRKLTSSTGRVSSSETNQINILSHLTDRITAPGPLSLTLLWIPLGGLCGEHFSGAGAANAQSQQSTSNWTSFIFVKKSVYTCSVFVLKFAAYICIKTVVTKKKKCRCYLFVSRSSLVFSGCHEVLVPLASLVSCFW